MIGWLTTISWGAPRYFVIVVPLILVVLALTIYRFMHVRRTCRLLAGKWYALLIHNFSYTRAVLKGVCGLLGFSLLAIVLLRPQSNKQEQTVTQEGRDLFIALDVSRSMLAADCVPNRLQCAKDKIKQLLQHLACERIGLILFSGSAFVQCPLTSDYGAFMLFLDAVDVETISSGTTALDQALKQALHAFGSMENRKNKLLMLFTDGEDFSTNLNKIKKDAHDQGLHIFTIGVGTPDGAPIPLYDDKGRPAGHQKDTHGKVVISRLNEGILHALATDVDGMYLPIARDASDIQELVRHVHQFEKEELGDKTYAQKEEQYSWFLLGSFIFFACEWLI